MRRVVECSQTRACLVAGSRLGTHVRASAAAAAVLSLAACSNHGQPPANWQPTRVERPLPAAPLEPVRTAAAAPSTPATSYPPLGRMPRVQGVYKVGKPYSINGVTYVPGEDRSYDRVGMASWYGTDFHGKQTANGEMFDMDGVSAAHPTLPMPSYVHVTNLRNGRTMIVRVNDRGPYKPGRIIDLSKRTAQMLGFDGQGMTEIRVRYAGAAPLDPRDDRRERQYLAAQPWYRTAATGWSQRSGLGSAPGVAAEPNAGPAP